MLGDLCEGVIEDPQSTLSGPIRGTRFLITACARAGIGEKRFIEDLDRLADDSILAELIDVLRPCCERAVPLIRQMIVSQTVAEHGKLVEDSNWRIDNILSSEHGDEINVPVAVLTFRYQEGEKRERITLHLLPEQLAKLKTACDRMIQ
jgi:hypothetical protein